MLGLLSILFLLITSSTALEDLTKVVNNGAIFTWKENLAKFFEGWTKQHMNNSNIVSLAVAVAHKNGIHLYKSL